MTTHDRISIGGFASLGGLVVALGGLVFFQIDWLRGDFDSRINEVKTPMSNIDEKMQKLGERTARIEGGLSIIVAWVGSSATPNGPGETGSWQYQVESAENQSAYLQNLAGLYGIEHHESFAGPSIMK